MGFWLRFMSTRRFVFLLLATLKALFVLEFAPQRVFFLSGGLFTQRFIYCGRRLASAWQ